MSLLGLLVNWNRPEGKNPHNLKKKLTNVQALTDSTKILPPLNVNYFPFLTLTLLTWRIW